MQQSSGEESESKHRPAGTRTVPASILKAGTESVGNLTPEEAEELQVQLEKDKRAVYQHPLFPLMALLFEKCEQATQSPDPPTSASFDVDIEEFVNRLKREGSTFFIEDTEIDTLMIKAIQVLRIHLLELEKVNELCKDFCHRYITCLKSKMHSENLLRDERGEATQFDSQYLSNGDLLDLEPPPTEHNQIQNHPTSTPNSQPVILQHGTHSPANQYQAATVVNSAGQVVYTPVIPQGVVTPQGLLTQSIPGNNAHHHHHKKKSEPPQQQQQQQQQHVVPIIHGSTPLSQIGISHQGQSPGQQQPPSMLSLSQGDLRVAMADAAEVNDLLNKRKPKRGVLPKHATTVMRSWLFQHIVHPYPSEDEKRMIAAQTNLTMLQVNNWFINARRRILQPMLDASNPEAATKNKKPKSQNRPSTQRFWPQSLAQLGQTTTVTQSTAGGTNALDRRSLDDEASAALSSSALDSVRHLSSDSMSPMLGVRQRSPSSVSSLDNLGASGGDSLHDDDEDDDLSTNLELGSDSGMVD
ncbi:homeobox protein PKNOX1-like isoform X1 [Lytechinus variegatus]|uniref:homeobox protein PKNOX1-like isoform X1 n=1 Tax=Lytechinus variegatus TaxID=7654 RepID=UPI001BB2A95E|nr:homeobox protein PKNOX1-like isoform X1 [Lytechinus variegatus]